MNTKIDELEPLEKDILRQMAIRVRTTTQGLALSCFDDVFPTVHPKKVRDSVKRLVEKGYMISPDDHLERTSAVFFTDDGLHESRIVFKSEIESHQEKEDLVNKYIKKLRSNPVVAIVIIVCLAIPWIIGILRLLNIILKIW